MNPEPIDNVQSFSSLAPYYESHYHWRKMPETWSEITISFTREKALSPQSLLDVCCGTGLFLKHITAQMSFNTTCGIDGNEEMLAQARNKNIKDTDLVLADVRDFNLEKIFDLATCQYSALNYLTADGELEAALRCIRRHLEREGWFLFDVNSYNGLKALKSLHVINQEEQVLIQSAEFHQKSGVAHMQTDGFMRAEDGRYDRMIYVEEERGRSLDDLEAAFTDCGFGPLEFLHTCRGKSRQDVNDEWRQFFAVQAI